MLPYSSDLMDAVRDELGQPRTDDHDGTFTVDELVRRFRLANRRVHGFLSRQDVGYRVATVDLAVAQGDETTDIPAGAEAILFVGPVDDDGTVQARGYRPTTWLEYGKVRNGYMWEMSDARLRWSMARTESVTIRLAYVQAPVPFMYGVAEDGGPSAIRLAHYELQHDGALDDVEFAIVDGTGAGQTNTVDSYLGATRDVTTVDPWATEPDDTSVYANRLNLPAESEELLHTLVVAGCLRKTDKPRSADLLNDARELARDLKKHVSLAQRHVAKKVKSGDPMPWGDPANRYRGGRSAIWLG